MEQFKIKISTKIETKLLTKLETKIVFLSKFCPLFYVVKQKKPYKNGIFV